MWLVLALAPPPALGGEHEDTGICVYEPAGPIEPEVQAEYFRLSDELRKLAARGLWNGVERTWEQVAVLGVPLAFRDYLAGAEAARHDGELMAAYERMACAARLEGTREVVEWLWNIDTHYGRVHLRTEPVEPSALVVDRMPSMPEAHLAVQTAIDRVREKGEFQGLLPAGRYVFAGQPFEVSPGPRSVEIVVKPVKLHHRWRR